MFDSDINYDKFDIEDLDHRDDLLKALRFVQGVLHSLNRRKGWWNEESARHPLMTPTRMMLIVSEVSEAMEAERTDAMDDKLPHHLGKTVELGDAVIRVFDLGGGEGLPIPEAIVEKCLVNWRRADHDPANRAKKGGKKW